MLIYGLGYLFLHMYSRYFIFLIIGMTTYFFFGFLGILVSAMVVMYDCYRLANKIKDGQLQLPQKNTLLTIFITIMIITSTAYVILPKYLYAFSESSCDFLYPIKYSFDLYSNVQSISKNSMCKDKVIEGKTLFTFYKSSVLKDNQCEAEGYTLRNRCYFKKAVDSKNFRYCYATSVKSQCIRSLAVQLKDKELCKSDEFCKDYFETCTKNPDDRDCKLSDIFFCKGLLGVDEKYKEECIKKYGITKR